jgi:ATP-dependent helicase Lhr and Lhr-like helicase
VTKKPPPPPPSRFAKRGRAAAATHVQGRWSLTAQLFPSATPDPAARRRALAELLLERYGILTREQVSAEGVSGGFSAIYPELTQLETLGIARRGYFVEGLGGAQFALPGAVERLRERPSREEQPLVLSAVDPAQPYGAALPWPKRAGRVIAAQRAPARQAGALLVLSGGEPILYLERGGRSLQTLVTADDPRLPPALAKLVEHVRAGRGALRRLGLEKVDGEPALASPLGPALIANGFQEGPRRLTLSA